MIMGLRGPALRLAVAQRHVRRLERPQQRPHGCYVRQIQVVGLRCKLGRVEQVHGPVLAELVEDQRMAWPDGPEDEVWIRVDKGTLMSVSRRIVIFDAGLLGHGRAQEEAPLPVSYCSSFASRTFICSSTTRSQVGVWYRISPCSTSWSNRAAPWASRPAGTLISAICVGRGDVYNVSFKGVV
jgi:hypothetical protein